MPDLNEIIGGVGDFLVGVSNAATINQWLDMSQQDALQGIESFIKNASTASIDSMDASLLHLAAFHLDIHRRVILVKYYSFFKVVEFNRFQTWRGFPRPS